MNKLFLAATFALQTAFALAQETDTLIRKGSYLYYGQPAIEDNSMLIEEAFNQEAGIIQHISNFIFDGGNFLYGYTQEIPLADVKHQFSFGVSYSSVQTPNGLTQLGHDLFEKNGLGDIFINYRPLLWGKNDWALVIPRFTAIIPTGNAQYGFGAGGWGGQFNLAVTKRLGPKITTHYNAGYTKLFNADCYSLESLDVPRKLAERNLNSVNVGMSAIWLVADNFNLMLESVYTTGSDFNDTGSLLNTRSLILNPGFRTAFQIGKVQVVPGAGVPITFTNGNFQGRGAFLYLSIEPAY